MEKIDHIILCGGVPAPRRAKEDQILRLNLGGDDPNVDLEIIDISRRLSSDVPDVLTDLVEIASYVYCADQAITRGGQGVVAFGERWRRDFVFHIPVRVPSIWSAKESLDVLQKTLSMLSDDTYTFHFTQRVNAVPMQQYLKFEGTAPETQELDEVLLFSGGVDSLGGTVQEAVVDKRRVALVSHRSNSKIFSRQKKLVDGLRGRCAANPPLHVPVWVRQRGTSGREYTQRTRTFLYCSLAVAVARVFGLKRLRFYENGVVGLNLPISEQAVGSRATRTTHPQVLSGFTELFSLLAQERFVVENPFLWLTKTEVFDLIGDAGCADLTQDSVSCMHTREQTIEQPHCGRCSQCVSRRYAALASKYAASDPANLYKVDLLIGERLKDIDYTLVESFIRRATEFGKMNELELVEHYGEVARVLRHLRPLSSDQVAGRVIQLYRRHSSDVTKVMDDAIRDHASDIREEKLPATCAILLAIPESYKKVAAGEPSGSSRDSSSTTGRGGTLKIPAWLKTSEPGEKAKPRLYSKGSLDLPEQADPVWTIDATQKSPIPITRLNGEVVWIDPAAPQEPDDAVIAAEDEQRITEGTVHGRSELRAEIEKLFSGPDWPLTSVIVEPFRHYATKIFDVNAAAYHNAAPSSAGDAQHVLSAMLHNLLTEVFGREWESSPGEQVTRTDWQQDSEGWKGKEFVVVAGNDPDPSCQYHQLISDAIKYRYRFHAPLPAPLPGEPPGINLSNEEWWRYIGLNERHNLAMAIKPYLEDRKAHWQSVCALSKPSDAANGPETESPKSDSTAAGAGTPRESHKIQKPVRRNQKYEVIDKALQEIAESRPSTQEEVFQSLDGRRVVTPPAEPFITARGWIAGFRRDAAAARAWLSKRWTELHLAPLPRGPKKQKK